MQMKTMSWLSVIILAGALALVGCGKSDKSAAQGMPQGIDLLKFQQAFPSPTPEQQGSLEKVISGVRYRLYPQALQALEKLATDQTLTEPQKKAVNDLIEGIKQTLSSAAPPAPK